MFTKPHSHASMTSFSFLWVPLLQVSPPKASHSLTEFSPHWFPPAMVWRTGQTTLIMFSHRKNGRTLQCTRPAGFLSLPRLTHSTYVPTTFQHPILADRHLLNVVNMLLLPTTQCHLSEVLISTLLYIFESQIVIWWMSLWFWGGAIWCLWQLSMLTSPSSLTLHQHLFVLSWIW